MRSLFQNQLLLMLKNASELAANAIGKALVVFKIFLKKIFEFGPCHSVLCFRVTFVLILSLNNCSVEK